MSAIANQSSGYTGVQLKNVGDSVAGRIVSFNDYQVTEFGSKVPKWWVDGKPVALPADQASGFRPVEGAKIDLEAEPGNEASRVTLWAEKANMLKAIAGAVRAQGRTDIAVGDDLAVTFSGFEGRAHAFTAAYSPAES